MKKGLLFGLISLIGLSGLLLTGSGCANIIPPQGGARDSIAPVLLKVVPGDSALRFTGKKIDFYFDEYIEVQDAPMNVLVSPLPAVNPVVDSRLRDLSVKLKDTLLPNTTYTIDFGNAVKDFTEGNVAKGLRYIFSTGSYIDSLELKGQVIIAETGKTDSTLIAVLHTDGKDSAVMRSRPSYVSRLDRNGRFHFRNLPPHKYFLYAMKDDGGSRRYMGGAQLFAFADEVVDTEHPADSLILYAFAEKQEGAGSFVVTGPAAKEKPDTDKRLKYLTGLQNNQQDLTSAFELIFEKPLLRFDTSGVKLYADSTYTAVDSLQFKKDSTNKKWSLITPWKEGLQYHLILTKGAAEDSAGKQWLKTDTLHFKTKLASDYGKLSIRLRGLNLKRSPVLLFMQGDRVFRSASMTENSFKDNLFTPGEYTLRILYDENGNGKWDTGQFFGKRRQPEKIQPLEKKISVKTNWTNEYEVEVPNR